MCAAATTSPLRPPQMLVFNLFSAFGYHLADALGIPCLCASPGVPPRYVDVASMRTQDTVISACCPTNLSSYSAAKYELVARATAYHKMSHAVSKRELLVLALPSVASARLLFSLSAAPRWGGVPLGRVLPRALLERMDDGDRGSSTSGDEVGVSGRLALCHDVCPRKEYIMIHHRVFLCGAKSPI